MSLQFRMVATDLRPEPFDATTFAMSAWVAERDPGTTFPAVGDEPVVVGAREFRATAAEDGGLRLLRQVVVDNQDTGRWTTTLTTLADGDHGWQWVDLERVSDDPWGPTPTVRAPGVVRRLLAGGTLRVGGTPLPARLLRVAPGDAPGQLAALLLDRSRSIPVVVVSPGNDTDGRESGVAADRLSQELLGAAPVYLLERGAVGQLSNLLGPDLSVYGGAARTYLPGLVVGGSNPMRHRVLGPARLRDTGLAVRTIAAPLRRQALATRPPVPYRERGRTLLTVAAGGADPDVLVAEALAAEQAAEKFRADAKDLSDELEWQAALAEETESDLDTARARIRWLESRLADADQHVVGTPTPETASPQTVGSFAEAVAAAREHLTMLDVGDVGDRAAQLDEYPQSGVWARRAWRALQALDAYARDKATGFSGDVRGWCMEGGPHAVSVTWISLTDSGGPGDDPAFGRARTFPVPADVDPAGEVFMPAHVRIVEGGRPAPRIHFHDDTAGTTGKVHVGYVGPHLPNKQTD